MSMSISSLSLSFPLSIKGKTGGGVQGGGVSFRSKTQVKFLYPSLSHTQSSTPLYVDVCVCVEKKETAKERRRVAVVDIYDAVCHRGGPLGGGNDKKINI